MTRFVTLRPRPGKRLTLYCFPFAGGSAGSYRRLSELLPDYIEVRSVQLPGRQDRMAEPAFTDFHDLVSALADALVKDMEGGRYALFGHSMGALVAWELTRELRRRGERSPALLAVSGCSAPQTRTPGPPTHSLTEEEFIAEVRALGGLPDEVLHDPDLLTFVLPPLRADMAVRDDHRYVPEEPVRTPITVFAGTRDQLCSPEQARAWEELTGCFLGTRFYGGGHFFLFDHLPRILSELVRDVHALASEPSVP